MHGHSSIRFTKQQPFSRELNLRYAETEDDNDHVLYTWCSVAHREGSFYIKALTREDIAADDDTLKGRFSNSYC